MTKKILLILCMLIILNLFASCGLYSYSFVIIKYPERLVYVAGYDTELDLTGGEVGKIIVKLGVETTDIFPMSSSLIVHKIDFDVPGVYMVKIYNSYNQEVKFAVQVVDENCIENIIGQEPD